MACISYTQIKQIFEKIGTGDTLDNGKGKHKEIKSFIFGTVEGLQAYIKSEAEYPLLFVEMPDIELEGEFYYTYKGSAVVLVQYAKGDYTEQLSAIQISENIISDILAYLIHTTQNNHGLRINLDAITFQAVDAFTADNLIGLRMPFEISGTKNLTYNAQKWQLL